ncbi:cation:proton antiporter, partial [Candidatus Curtissbacteria bacterium]|nr:cation:proton antiporter [Candidatus Curtissbacteria bacterium]
MPPAFLELSAVLVLCALLGIVVRLFKQPLILAYIFSGVIIASVGYFGNFDRDFFEALSSMGIAFLLFLVGVELRLEDLKYVGKAAVLTGIGQIVFTALVGFIILSALGFATVPAIYIAVALTFSSTVIIVKLLSEKNDLQSLHGKIAIGFLLIQDFVAIIALMLLSGFGAGGAPGILGIALIFLKGLFLIGTAYAASRWFLKFFFNLASLSTELLFVAAISWAFLFSVFAAALGFSIAIGAFLAGLGIAASPYRVQISARVKP